MGGGQVDLTGTPFIFHARTAFKSNGFGTKTRVSIDGVPVKHKLDFNDWWTLDVTGGKILTMNAGGYCGNTDAFYFVTLEPEATAESFLSR